ncbi:MAG: YesL family protein [Anaerolineae bacterium]
MADSGTLGAAMINQSMRDQAIDAYMAAIPLIVLNVLWFIALLPIVTAVPATGALFYATNRLAHGKSADTRVFIEGFRRYFWRSWLWGVLNIFVAAVLVSNFVFYGQFDDSWAIWTRAVVIALALVWVAIQLYTFPLMIEQEKPLLRQALRNSVVILLRRPVYSFGIAIVIVLIAALSTLLILPLWVLLSGSVCAYLANRATLSSIMRITGKPSLTSSPAEDSTSAV